MRGLEFHVVAQHRCKFRSFQLAVMDPGWFVAADSGSRWPWVTAFVTLVLAVAFGRVAASAPARRR